MSFKHDKFPYVEFVKVSEDGKILFRLTENWNFTYNSQTFTVPKDFISDGASIPKIAQSIFPSYGKYIEATTAHDYFYNKKEREKLKVSGITITRSKVDWIFYSAMKEDKVSLLTRITFYLAVRVGGWIGWNS